MFRSDQQLNQGLSCKTKGCWLFSKPAFTVISLQQPYITTAAVLDVLQHRVMLSAQNKVEAFARTGTYPFSLKGADVVYNCFSQEWWVWRQC